MLHYRNHSLVITGTDNEIIRGVMHVMIAEEQDDIVWTFLLELYYRTEILYQIFWLYVFIRIAIITKEDKHAVLVDFDYVFPTG